MTHQSILGLSRYTHRIGNPPDTLNRTYTCHRQCTCSHSFSSSRACLTPISQNHKDRLNACHRNLMCKITDTVWQPRTIPYPRSRLRATYECQKMPTRKSTTARWSFHTNWQSVNEYGSSFFSQIERAIKLKVKLFSS